MFNIPKQWKLANKNHVWKIKNDGWYDTYCIAKQKDEGITVEGSIDGWKNSKHNEQNLTGMRMDHIWCNQSVSVKHSRVMFNGNKQKYQTTLVYVSKQNNLYIILS